MGIENTAGADSPLGVMTLLRDGAACDFCVKNAATRANASQCGHWGRAPIRQRRESERS